LAGLVLIVAAIAAIAGYGAAYRPQIELPAGLKGQFIDVMGIRTRYVQTGAGPDVLLIHGSTGSVDDWAPVTDALAPNFRVTTYDRPGHGYSSAGPRCDYEYNADFAVALIRALQLH